MVFPWIECMSLFHSLCRRVAHMIFSPSTEMKSLAIKQKYYIASNVRAVASTEISRMLKERSSATSSRA